MKDPSSCLYVIRTKDSGVLQYAEDGILEMSVHLLHISSLFLFFELTSIHSNTLPYTMAPGLNAVKALNPDQRPNDKHLYWGRLALLLSDIFLFFESI